MEINRTIEKMILEQKEKESKLANLISQDLERAYEFVLSEVGKLVKYKDRTFVPNKLANELDLVYNELVERYPEYEDELYELLPNKYEEDLVSKDRYLRIITSIAMLVFIKSFLEHMFGEQTFDGFEQFKDNPVLGYKLIDRLIKNVKHLSYMLMAWATTFLDTGQLDEGAFKVSKAVVSWFKAIVTDFMTYYSRYDKLWELQRKGIKSYQFYTSEDERVCSECGAIHEEVFSVNEAIVGSNFPPIHNRCRCWIVEVED